MEKSLRVTFRQNFITAREYSPNGDFSPFGRLLPDWDIKSSNFLPKGRKTPSCTVQILPIGGLIPLLGENQR